MTTLRDDGPSSPLSVAGDSNGRPAMGGARVPDRLRPSWKALLGLAALAVEGPFLVTCLGVQVLTSCAHCRTSWLKLWALLPGCLSSFIPAPFRAWAAGLGIPLKLPEGTRFVQWGICVVVMILILAAACRLTRRWRVVLAVGSLLSCLLAFVAYSLMAA